MKRDHIEIKRFIFFTEESFLIYFGQNYESTVLHANRHCIPVIRIVNANGTRSALPLERANSLLEKYYKLRDEQAQEVYHAQLNEMAPVGHHPVGHHPVGHHPVGHHPVGDYQDRVNEDPTVEKALISGAA